MRFLLYATALIGFGIGFTSCSQPDSKPNYPPRVYERLDSLFAHISDTTPGYALAVVQDTQMVVEYYKGMANMGEALPIGRHSSFNLASLSKQFTGACVVRLILDGKLDLEDPVADFIPHFPTYPDTVQVKHLVYMTSGIPEYYTIDRQNGSDWSSLAFFSVDTAIDASLGVGELSFTPGSQWAYSNVNYMLLTKIVEQVSGMPFSQFVRQEVMDPAGMKHALVHDDLFQIIPKQVLGYNKRDSANTTYLLDHGYMPRRGDGYMQIHRHSPHYGGSGLYASIADLRAWHAYLVQLDSEADPFYSLLHQTMRFQHDKANDAFGLVWGDFQAHPMIWYEGGDWGFSTYMMRFPAQKMTVICLANLGAGRAASHAFKALDILIEEGVVRLE